MEIAWILGFLAAVAGAMLILREYARHRRRRARLEYQQLLQQALDDGVLTPEELASWRQSAGRAR
jgi:hypothetical protein